VQQGDPLGPLLFCLTALELTSQLMSELNIWYMDDGTLFGDVTNLLHDLDIVKSVGSKLGLLLNERKCELVTADAHVLAVVRQKMPDVIHVAPEDATLSGAPVGGQRGITSTLIAKLSELQRLSDRLKHLNTHDAFFLLKNCFSLPKRLYTLRCAPCVECPIIKQYDTLLRNTLQSILDVALDDTSWEQATLPVKRGGLGIQTA
jgi:hypothetical protein